MNGNDRWQILRNAILKKQIPKEQEQDEFILDEQYKIQL